MQVTGLALLLCFAVCRELWHPVQTSVSDAFNPVCVRAQEKGVVFLRDMLMD